jgi:hypothetical protein
MVPGPCTSVHPIGAISVGLAAADCPLYFAGSASMNGVDITIVRNQDALLRERLALADLAEHGNISVFIDFRGQLMT